MKPGYYWISHPDEVEVDRVWRWDGDGWDAGSDLWSQGEATRAGYLVGPRVPSVREMAAMEKCVEVLRSSVPLPEGEPYRECLSGVQRRKQGMAALSDLDALRDPPQDDAPSALDEMMGNPMDALDKLSVRRPMETKLKPCPFCGSENVRVDFWLRDGGAPRVWRAECLSCTAKSADYLTSEKATKHWNRRTEATDE